MIDFLCVETDIVTIRSVIMKYKGKRMELKRRLDSKLASFSKHVEYSEEECKKKEEEYRKSLEISPILIPKIILRF